MHMGLTIDGNYLDHVKDLHTDEELFEIQNYPIIFIEIGVLE